MPVVYAVKVAATGTATQSATEVADQSATDGADQSTTDSDGIGIGVDEEGVVVVVAAGV